jgi:hypothetical protein
MQRRPSKMASDDRITFAVDDLLVVQVECSSCGTAIGYPREKATKANPTAITSCPGCGKTWYSETAALAWKRLTETLTRLQDMEAKKEDAEEIPFLLRFQVRRPGVAEKKLA